MTACWWQRRAEQSYGVVEADLTPWRSWSLPVLRKAFNEVKHTDPRFAGWWAGKGLQRMPVTGAGGGHARGTRRRGQGDPTPRYA